MYEETFPFKIGEIFYEGEQYNAPGITVEYEGEISELWLIKLVDLSRDETDYVFGDQEIEMLSEEGIKKVENIILYARDNDDIHHSADDVWEGSYVLIQSSKKEEYIPFPWKNVNIKPAKKYES